MSTTVNFLNCFTILRPSIKKLLNLHRKQFNKQYSKMKKILLYVSLVAMILCICGRSQAQKVTLLNIVERDTVMSDDAKKIFKMLNINDVSFGKGNYVEVDEPYFASSDNGFIAPVTIKNKAGYQMLSAGVQAQFRIYKADDGKYLVVFSDLLEDPIKFWSYDNGTLTSLPKYKLPIPTHGKKSKKNPFIITFLPNGYSIMSNGIFITDGDWVENYIWNGKEFEKLK